MSGSDNTVKHRQVLKKDNIHEEDERVKLIFDATPLACSMVTTNQKIVDCNEMAVNMFGYRDKQEFMEKYWDSIPEYQPNGRLSMEMVKEYVGRAVKEGQVTFEWLYKLRNGDEMPAEVTLARVHYKGEIVVVRYIRDLREFKAMLAEINERTAERDAQYNKLLALQQELEDALNAAKVANNAKSSFLASMSHEIRTPMNAIIGITEILVENETLPNDVMEGLYKIYNSCGLLLNIINDILDFSKIEAGKLDITPAPYEVASLIDDCVQLNIMRIGSRPIEFSVQVDENIPARLIGDEQRIKQILNNLLSNAFKYTDIGEVKLSVAFEPVTESSDITLILSVSDTGHGMTAEQVERLFEEYTRFNTNASRTIEGTGLGMAITQRLVYLMNGNIFLESQPGKGSLFIIKLPQKKVDSEILGKELTENLQKFQLTNVIKRKKVQITRDPMPYGKVLIVDDAETNLYVAAGLMKLYKLQIDTVMSGFEAIDKIKNGNKYDIVFMDHMMPKMDGIEATKQLRSLGYNDPIVALTANAVAGQADVFLNNGFDEFIAKPIDVRQLDTILNKLIRDKQPVEVIEAARLEKTENHESKHNIGRNSNKPMPVSLYVGIQSEHENKNDNGADELNKETDPLLMMSFVRDASRAVIVLEKFCADEDLDNERLRELTGTIHGMKSALANIGESELSKTAQELEFAGRELKTMELTAGVPKFLNDLKVLLERLESKQDSSPGDESQADEDIGYLHRKLLAVGEMCADYNRKGASDLIADIKRRKNSKKTIKMLDRIMEQVLHSDFEEAEKTASEYASELEILA